MRVAHLTTAHSRDDVRIFLKECRSLVDFGYRVSLVVADGEGDELRDGVSIIDAGASKNRFYRMWSAPNRVLSFALDVDADVYHLHDPELLTICFSLKRRGKRVIFDAHEDVPKQILSKHYLHPLVRSRVADLFSFYEKYVCANLDGIIAATPLIRMKFEKINDRVADIANFPILGELDAPRQRKNGGSEICYVGSIAGVRGIREIMQALEMSDFDVLLNLVGNFSEEDTELEVRNSAGWKKVLFWGSQDRSGVRNVLSSSVAGLVTLHPTANYKEALPVKMFEYMAAGIPVIASNFPLWRDIVEGWNCGVCVDPLDPGEISQAIESFVCNPDYAQRLGENGRKAIIERFNWGVEAQKLYSFYELLR